MTTQTNEYNPFRAARVAGLLYVLLAMIGPFSILYMPTTVFTFGDAAANAASMAEHTSLLRLGILADMAIIVMEIFITAIFYALFKSFSGTWAAVAAFARLGMIVVMVLNLINYLMALHILSGADYLNGFAPEQLDAFALMFVEMHEFGVYAWQVFFGVHLVALGWMIMKSGYFPRIIGLAAFVGSFGYSLQAVEKFVVPGQDLLVLAVNGLLIVVALGEVALGLWMLIRGLNRTAWEKQNGFAAA